MKLYQFFAFCLQNTFEGAKSWVKELRDERPSIVIALAGNKADLGSERKVTFEMSSSYSFFTLSFCLPNLVHTVCPGNHFETNVSRMSQNG